MKILIYCFIVLIYAFNQSYAQQRNLDSLEKIIHKNLKDTTEVKALVSLSSLIRNSDMSKAIKLNAEAYKLAQTLNFKKGIGLSNLNTGTINHLNGYFDSAEVYYNKALVLFTELKLKKNISKCHNNLGNLYQLKADFTKAIEHLFICKKIAEDLHDDKGLADCELNIGNVYLQKKEFNNAIKQFYSALPLYTKLNDLPSMAQLYNNIGATQRYMNNFDSALFNYKRSLVIRNQIKDNVGIPETVLNIGDVYSQHKNYDSSIVYFKKAYSLYKNINHQTGMAYSLNNLGGSLFNSHHDKEALDTLFQAVKLSTILGLRDLKLESYKAIAELFFYNKKYKESAEYMSYMSLLKDSLLNENSNKQIAEMQTKYETEKKNKEIIKQTAEIKNQQIEAQKKAIEYRALMIGFILIGALSLFIFMGYKQKQKANKIITLQKFEVEKQKEVVEHKNLIIEEKQKEIIDSINYAKRIQYTLLAHADFLKANIPNHFVYFNPKDIVSGDFYWATKKDNLFYLAVCDSTGHGVPGAFMSLLNIGFLSEAINEKNIVAPNEILNYVRQRLIVNISKDGQKDGFDGVLICIDLQSKQITYSAANNKPVLIRNNTYNELDADRMPVGMGERKEDFKLYHIDIIEGDSLYLYTDGYADQFGGAKGKKYKYKSLNEFILANHTKSLSEQQQLIQSNFDYWRGNLEQVDDVCVIGIRL